MRALAGLALLLVFPTAAIADDNVNAAVAATPPSSGPATDPAIAPDPAQPPPDYSQPPAAPAARVKSWFVTVGLGAAGYIGRPIQQNDDSDSGPAIELVAGKWLASQDMAIGARLEAHTDDAQNYTDSSLTLIGRFGLGGTRAYVEPGLGLGFHREEQADNAESGLAVAVTLGYSLLKNRFALDLRGGFAHYRQDIDRYEHGLIWIGAAIGLQ